MKTLENNIKTCYVCGKDLDGKHINFHSRDCRNIFETITITKKFRNRIKRWKDERGDSLMDFSFATGIPLGTLKPLLYSDRKNFNVYTIDRLCIFFEELFFRFVFNGELQDHYLNYLCEKEYLVG